MIKPKYPTLSGLLYYRNQIKQHKDTFKPQYQYSGELNKFGVEINNNLVNYYIQLITKELWNRNNQNPEMRLNCFIPKAIEIFLELITKRDMNIHYAYDCVIDQLKDQFQVNLKQKILYDDIERIKQSLSQIEQCVKQVQALKDNLVIQREQAQTLQQDRQQKNEDLLKQILLKQQKEIQLQNNIELLEQELQDLNIKQDEQNELENKHQLEIANITNDIKMIEAEIVLLEEQDSQYLADIQKLDDDIRSKQQQLDKLTGILGKNQTYAQELAGKYAEFNRMNEVYRKTTQQKNDVLQRLQLQKREKEAELQNITQQITSRNEQIVQGQQDIETIERSVRNLQGQILQQQDNINKQDEQIQKQTQQIAELEQQKVKYDTQIRDLQQQLSDKLAEQQLLQDEIIVLKENLQKQQNEYQDRQQSIKNKSLEMRKLADSIGKESMQYFEQIEELKQNISSLNVQKIQITADIEQIKQKIKKFASYSSHQQKVQTDHQKHIEYQRNQLELYRNEYEDLLQQKQDLDQQLYQSGDKLKKQQEQSDRTAKELERIRRDQQTLYDQIQQIQQDIDNIKRENRQIQQQIEQLAKNEQDLKQLTIDKNTAEQSLQKTDQQLQKLQTQIEEEEQKQTEYKDNLQQKQQQLIDTYGDDYAQKILQLQQFMEQLKRQQQQAELKLPRQLTELSNMLEISDKLRDLVITEDNYQLFKEGDIDKIRFRNPDGTDGEIDVQQYKQTIDTKDSKQVDRQIFGAFFVSELLIWYDDLDRKIKELAKEYDNFQKNKNKPKLSVNQQQQLKELNDAISDIQDIMIAIKLNFWTPMDGTSENRTKSNLSQVLNAKDGGETQLDIMRKQLNVNSNLDYRDSIAQALGIKSSDLKPHLASAQSFKQILLSRGISFSPERAGKIREKTDAIIQELVNTKNEEELNQVIQNHFQVDVLKSAETKIYRILQLLSMNNMNPMEVAESFAPLFKLKYLRNDEVKLSLVKVMQQFTQAVIKSLSKGIKILKDSQQVLSPNQEESKQQISSNKYRQQPKIKPQPITLGNKKNEGKSLSPIPIRPRPTRDKENFSTNPDQQHFFSYSTLLQVLCKLM